MSESPPKSEEIHRVDLSKSGSNEAWRVDSGFPSLTIGTPISHVQRPTVRLAQGRRATWQGAKQPFGSSSFPFAQRLA